MEEPRNKKNNIDRWNIDKERLHLNQLSAPSRDIKTISDVINTVMDNIESPIQESIVFLQENWLIIWTNIMNNNEELGRMYAEHTYPNYIKNNDLFINTSSASLHYELNRMKPLLLKQLNHSYDSLNIRNILFELDK